MDWQTITIAGFIALAVVLVLYFSVKETRPIHVLEQPLSSSDHHASEITTHVQRELKGSKEFQDEEERMIIVSQIKSVNKAICVCY